MQPGSHILITGASSGIGKELARQLRQAGHRMSVLARRESALRELQAELGGQDSVLALKADVSDFADLKSAVARAERELGPIDIIIANAGIAETVRADDMNSISVKAMIDTNFLGLIHTVGAVMPYFRQRGRGHIVGISSLTSYLATERYSVYGATKTAASAYLKSLRLELKTSGILVSSVCPGFIRTPMTAENDFEMPFLLDVDVAARRIVSSIEKKTEVFHFPKRAFFSIRMLNALPASFYRAFMKKLKL